MTQTEIPQPTGKTTRYWFSADYRQAMEDVLAKLEEAGFRCCYPVG
jgi:hypothetical protein